MIFQKLQNFVTVAECGSINRAAERLFISQQALRSSINSLERQLGFALFSRSSQGARLTEQGQAILEDVRQILSLAEGWQRYARPAVADPETVEILASTVVCNTVLADVVRECRARYPKLRVRFFHSRDDEMMATLDVHAIGVISSAPEGIVTEKLRPFAERSGLDIELFGMDHFCVYLNTANPLAGLPYLDTSQLKGLTLAAYPGEDTRFFYHSIYRYFSDTPPFFIEQQESIFQMIADMEDVAAVFPHLAIFNNSYVEQGLITALPVKNHPMPGISCMICPKYGQLTPGQRVVTAMIRQRLEELTRRLAQEDGRGQPRGGHVMP